MNKSLSFFGKVAQTAFESRAYKTARKAALPVAAALAMMASSQKASAQVLDYSATFSGTFTGINYKWVQDQAFLDNVAGGSTDVITLNWTGPGTGSGLTYTVPVSYSIKAGDTYPTYSGNGQATFSFTQVNATDETLKISITPSTVPNNNELGTIRIYEQTSILDGVNLLSSFLGLANSGTYAASNFTTLAVGGTYPNGNAVGTISNDSTLGFLNSNGQEVSSSHTSGVLSSQNFTLTSNATPEPGTVALLVLAGTTLLVGGKMRMKNKNLTFKNGSATPEI